MIENEKLKSYIINGTDTRKKAYFHKYGGGDLKKKG